MKTFRFKSASLAAIAFATLSACSAGDIDTYSGDAQEEGELVSLGTAEQGVMSCSNPDGTNAAMAAFAVAVAQDLGRWQAGKDFVLANTNGVQENSSGWAQTIKLTSGSDASGPKGKSRCSDGKCARVQALLDMQYDQANNKVYFQGSGSTKVLLNPSALRSRMTAKLGEQQTYDARAKDGKADQAPKEEHKLSFVSATKGGCDTNFTFRATKTNGAALQYPSQLKYKVAFADVHNPYIGFQNLGNGNVSIDPTWGLNEDGTNSGGSCSAACTKVSLASVAGQCCSCGGANKKYAKAGWSATTFLCQ